MMNQKRHDLFSSRLKDRIRQHGIENLSEDCIRYDYFASLVEAENHPTADLILEYAHPNQLYQTKGKKEIDCVVSKKGDELSEAIEFKFFPSHGTVARLGNMGGLFADCYRLADTDIPLKSIVLVSTSTMNSYIDKPQKKFSFLLSDSVKKKQIDASFYRDIDATFFKEIKKHTYSDFDPFSFTIDRIFLERSDQYVIAVFRVNKS